MADLIQQIEEVLTILHGPGSPESRVDRVTARLKAVQYEIEEQPSEDALDRIALLFAAILTADGMLRQAAEDVLPGRPGNVTYRQYIENWLREAS